MRIYFYVGFFRYSFNRKTKEVAIGNWGESHRFPIRAFPMSILRSAIQYKKMGFENEGILKKDKILADGKYHNTVMMGRLNE
ncbi:hypothetical protein ASL14_06780 [Paenibacillus sp. IHB B 3084]|nr:hypothetical protein ASL14_06780 [Paenibacillus sp. IHB B 3084]